MSNVFIDGRTVSRQIQTPEAAEALRQLSRTGDTWVREYATLRFCFDAEGRLVALVISDREREDQGSNADYIIDEGYLPEAHCSDGDTYVLEDEVLTAINNWWENTMFSVGYDWVIPISTPDRAPVHTYDGEPEDDDDEELR